MYPDDLRYTKTHEWAKVEGDVARIGLTHFAQDQLGDIVFVELPEVGREVKAGEAFSVIESVKAVSDCYSPVSGVVIEINTSLETSPEKVNQDPYGEGWLALVKMGDPSEVQMLMDSETYQTFLKEGGGL